MIPKIIHCCWFGGPKTKLALKCRRSWERFAPDWEIREWSDKPCRDVERVEDLPGYGFFEKAIAAKKWAMASDWLRMAALYREGGVYLDYDVELVGGLDELCAAGEWVASEWTVSGGTWPNPGSGIALEKGSAIALKMLEAYGRVNFDENRDMMPFINASLGAAIRASEKPLCILPPEVMSPIDVRGVCHRAPETRGIHHYAMSWGGPGRKILQWMSWHGLRWVVDFGVWVKRRMK